MDTGAEYLETQVLTASPEQLHLMVIDGALRFARYGLISLEQDDIEEAHEAFETEDYVEGRSAFLEKRDPRFGGA